MAFFYLTPDWFSGFDIALELLFGIVTALVAFFSFKVYKVCEQRECKLFGWAFVFISLAYFLWPIINLFDLSDISEGVKGLDIENLSLLLLGSVYFYIIFFILGLVTLIYIAFNLKNDKLYALILSLSIIVVIFSSSPGLAFHFVSALLLLYISLHYFKKYKKLNDYNSFLVFGAFSLLFFARFILIFSNTNHLLYVVNHLTELTAYIIIAISLAKSLRT